ncbi:exportin-4, partial [Thraustotheca clavata]
MELVEQACAAFASSQSSAERAAAERVLHEFKQSSNARGDAVLLLRNSVVPFAQFHAITTIRELSLLERVSDRERYDMIDMLLQHVCAAYDRLQSFVSSAVLVTTAVLIKRNWLAMNTNERRQMLGNIAALYQSDGPKASLIATKLLLAFVTEMTGGSDKKASAMGQPLAFHKACRQALENDGLRDILALSLSLIQQPLAPEVLHQGYLLCVEILAWHEVLNDQGSNSCLIELPNDQSKALLLQPSTLLQAMKQTYVTYPNESNLRHTIRQFLLQLASLTGAIFESSAEQLNYLQLLFIEALNMLECNLGQDTKEAEVIDMCQLVLRVCSNWGTLTTTEMATGLIESSTRLSCTLLQLAIQNASTTTTASDIWEMEGLDVLIDAWSIVIRKCGETNPSLHEATTSVVSLYIQLRLRMCGLDADEDENDDMEELVSKTIVEQVELVSALARLQPTQTLTLLHKLLTDIVSERSSFPNPTVENPQYSQLLERMHFLVLFSGIVLADDFRGEKPAMPSCYAGVAPLVTQVVGLLLQIAIDEMNLVRQQPHSPALSPFLSEQLLQTIIRISMTYFCQEPNSLPTQIQSTFPNESVVQVLLQVAIVYLTSWPTQPHIVTYAIDILLIFQNPSGAHQVLLQADFTTLVNSIFDVNAALFRRLSSQNRGLLLEALVRILVATPQSAATLPQLTATWFDTMQRLSASQGDVKATHAMEQQTEVLLEMLTGVARASESRSHEHITQVVLPYFPVIVQLLHKFHDVAIIVTLVLKFACDFVEANIAYANASNAMTIYQGCHELIRVYTSYNQGRSSHIANAEEENFEDVLMLLTLLSHLVSKDVIDFAESNEVSMQSQSVFYTTKPYVVFAGLHQVIPLMTASLLQYPRLSLQYFTLVSYLVDVYPDKLLHLSPDLLEMLLQSLVVGMQHTENEIIRYSFQAVSELASYHFKHHKHQTSSMFVTFINVILRLMVFESCSSVVLDGCAVALYPLLLVEKEQFYNIASTFCSEFPPELQEQLMNAFSALSQHIVQECTRANAMVTDMINSMGQNADDYLRGILKKNSSMSAEEASYLRSKLSEAMEWGKPVGDCSDGLATNTHLADVNDICFSQPLFQQCDTLAKTVPQYFSNIHNVLTERLLDEKAAGIVQNGALTPIASEFVQAITLLWISSKRTPKQQCLISTPLWEFSYSHYDFRRSSCNDLEAQSECNVANQQVTDMTNSMGLNANLYLEGVLLKNASVTPQQVSYLRSKLSEAMEWGKPVGDCSNGLATNTHLANVNDICYSQPLFDQCDALAKTVPQYFKNIHNILTERLLADTLNSSVPGIVQNGNLTPLALEFVEAMKNRDSIQRETNKIRCKGYNSTILDYPLQLLSPTFLKTKKFFHFLNFMLSLLFVLLTLVDGRCYCPPICSFPPCGSNAGWYLRSYCNDLEAQSECTRANDMVTDMINSMGQNADKYLRGLLHNNTSVSAEEASYLRSKLSEAMEWGKPVGDCSDGLATNTNLADVLDICFSQPLFQQCNSLAQTVPQYFNNIHNVLTEHLINESASGISENGALTPLAMEFVQVIRVRDTIQREENKIRLHSRCYCPPQCSFPVCSSSGDFRRSTCNDLEAQSECNVANDQVTDMVNSMGLNANLYLEGVLLKNASVTPQQISYLRSKLSEAMEWGKPVGDCSNGLATNTHLANVNDICYSQPLFEQCDLLAKTVPQYFKNIHNIISERLLADALKGSVSGIIENGNLTQLSREFVQAMKNRDSIQRETNKIR